MGQWSEGRNETGGGGGGTGDRCTCDAFLPSSTFPIGDLVEVERTAVEISQELELEMGKVVSEARSIDNDTFLWSAGCKKKKITVVFKLIFSIFRTFSSHLRHKLLSYSLHISDRQNNV